MTPKTLKIALAASVALNLFAAAGSVAVAVTYPRMVERLEAQARPARERSFAGLIAALSPDARERARQAVRASALAAQPDFDAAREARRQAIEAARQPEFDAAAVQALLEQSRLAEMRGRARLESDALAILGTLAPGDRETFSRILARTSKTRVHVQREEAAEAGPPPPR